MKALLGPVRTPLFFLSLSLGLIGCIAQRGQPVPTPAETLAAYRSALETNDPAAAYKLLSPLVKQRLTFEKFSADWKTTEAERATQRQFLTKSDLPIVTQAAVTLPQGTVLLLTPAGDGRALNLSRTESCSSCWRILDPDLGAIHAETPERVLSLLINAVEQRNYFALLRLLSASERQAIEAELRERTERLRMSLSNLSQQKKPPGPNLTPHNPAAPPLQEATLPSAIEVRGDRAHYQYDPRFFVDLVREKDGWRILDLN